MHRISSRSLPLMICLHERTLNSNRNTHILWLGHIDDKSYLYVPFVLFFTENFVLRDIYSKNSLSMSHFFEKAGHTAMKNALYVPARLICTPFGWFGDIGKQKIVYMSPQFYTHWESVDFPRKITENGRYRTIIFYTPRIGRGIINFEGKMGA